MPLRTLLTTLLLGCSFSAAAATAVVPLNHRTSTDLLPVAQKFIGKDGDVSAYGNKLIVNAPQEKIDELNTLISQLDTAPKRLLITVDTSQQNQQDSGDPQSRVITYSTESREGGTQQNHPHPPGRPSTRRCHRWAPGADIGGRIPAGTRSDPDAPCGVRSNDLLHRRIPMKREIAAGSLVALSTNPTARQTATIRSTDRWYMQENPR